MLDVADQVCPERTVARRIKAVGEDLTSQLKGLVPSFQLFSLALDESTDIDDTAQLLIFVRDISENFEITEELLSVESMKDNYRGRYFRMCGKCISYNGITMTENCQCYYGWLSIIDRKECWSTEETKRPCCRGRLHQGINISTLNNTSESCRQWHCFDLSGLFSAVGDQ